MNIINILIIKADIFCFSIGSTSHPVTPEEKVTATEILKAVVVVTAFGAVVGIVFLVFLLMIKQEKKGSMKENELEAQNADSHLPNIYDTILEEPDASFSNNVLYNTIAD